MRRQRNMAQVKEQNKTAEKELKKMEISNLSDAEFKTLVIRMIEKLIGYFKSIKMIQAEIKITLRKIKKNLQGINSGMDEADNEINDLEYKEEKIFNQNSKEKKKNPKKNKDRVRNLWDDFKCTNI